MNTMYGALGPERTVRDEEAYEAMSKTVKDMTTIYFVRHAESLVSHRDDRTRPLTEDAMKDRSIVLETLMDKRIDAFLCSPYKRSIDTISPAAEHFGMEIKTDERFRERRSGLNPREHCAGRWADFSFAEEGGECLSSVQERNMEALRDVLREYRGKTVVIGTHGTALSTMINYYDKSFGYDSFMKIVRWLPFIVEMRFDREEFLGYEIICHVQK